MRAPAAGAVDLSASAALGRASRRAPWAATQAAALRGLLGPSADADVIIDLATSHLATSTVGSYGSHWRQFVGFCESHELSPLPASTATCVLYVGHLVRSGRIQPQSLQPYLSAINRAHVDVLGVAEGPAGGPLIQQARRGWAFLHAAAPRDQRVGLPASVASRALDAALALQGTSPQVAQLFRALTFTALAFALMARADTDAHLQQKDVVVDIPSDCISFRFLAEKGREHVREKRVFSMPLHAVPGLAALIWRWQQFQIHESLRMTGRPPPPTCSFWWLPGLDPAPTLAGGSAARCSAWLAAACAHLGVTAPLGSAYTSHSIRKGAASSAAAIDVPTFRICWWGGWAANSGVMIKTYIDPTFQACAAARRFYGWLTAASSSSS